MRLRNFLGLSFEIAKSSFKLRNEGSYLGIFWYLLNPLLMFVLLLLVFSDRLGNNIPSYPLYLLLGIILFNFFQNTTTESTKIIVGDYGDLIKSINFPREALVFGIALKCVFSHFFEFVLFLAVMIIFGNSLSGIIFYPLILIFFFILALGFSLVLSSLTIYFVDLGNLWIFFIRLVWLATPIFYSIGGQNRLFLANLFNPVYYFITISRELIIYSRLPEPWIILGAVFYSLLSLLLGLLIFNKLKTKFAEML